MKVFKVSYKINWDFHPVGQGLFTTGGITANINQQEKVFRWVYDCGTSSRQKLIKSQIDRYISLFHHNNNEKIHLVVLSHFDKDHISGLTYLLNKCKIHTLLLPYTPLWKRLILAFEQGLKASSKYMDFYLNPAKYISDRIGYGRLDNIVFVQSGDAIDTGKLHTQVEEYENQRSIDDVSNEELDGFRITMKFALSLQGDAGEEKSFFDSVFSEKSVKVKFLKPHSNILIDDIWEFVPYNDEIIKIPPKSFIKEVFKNRSFLLQAKNQPSRNLILDKIKNLYDYHFRKTSNQRNIISLYLYGGIFPGLTNRHHLIIDYNRNSQKNAREMYWFYPPDKTGILYTGDGFVENINKFNNLKNNLSTQRLSNIFCLQVMHHGSRNNWFSGLASLIDPTISIFSSDPNRRRTNHPHPEVVKDFLPFYPVQVDSHSGFSIQFNFVIK